MKITQKELQIMFQTLRETLMITDGAQVFSYDKNSRLAAAQIIWTKLGNQEVEVEE